MLRAEQDVDGIARCICLVTSIHLLRVEQDLGQRDEVVVDADFNPLAPCGADVITATERAE